jgi:hypothetical protein
MTNKLVAIAGALLLLAGFGPYYALPVHAKASAVYSVDEPGRVPYQSVIFGTTASNCNSSRCSASQNQALLPFAWLSRIARRAAK